MTDFQILDSSKFGLSSPDSYVVTCSNTSYLRLLGKHPEWTLMTATASEDKGSVRVCSDQRRLIEAALRTSIDFGIEKPRVDADWRKREYVKICTVIQGPEENDDLVKSQLNEIIEKFFHFYNNHTPSGDKREEEMQFLYKEMVVENGNDVYLSDGVWLSSDGAIHDRGR